MGDLRVFSYGGGVQSTAALVLAARGVIDFPLFIFANVGDDSEHPATLRYVREVALPYATAEGILLIELHKVKRTRVPATGDTPAHYEYRRETLYERLTVGSDRSIGIPARLGGSGAPARRNCTLDFKMHVIAKELKRRGATEEEPATVGLGISLDEFHRARRGDELPAQRREYPLIDMRLGRQDCVNIIGDAGLLVPPKSSCYFCPFHRLSVWQEMRHSQPELYAKSVDLEALLSDRHVRMGRGPLFFTDKLVPLDRATSPHRQLPMFAADLAEDACESGYCMT